LDSWSMSSLQKVNTWPRINARAVVSFGAQFHGKKR
jgi:hypothetical protein